MFESKSGVLLIGGLGFFLFAFLSNAVVPILLYRHLPEKSVEELVAENANFMYQWEDLSLRYPESFAAHYGSPSATTAAEALRLGRQVYIGEGCWHCHSQFVRPVSNESERWGRVAFSEEYQNELQRPVMFGTRRVGPDLSREGGRRGNDWHAVHFFDPPSVSTRSPMPRYPWFFDGLSLGALVERLAQDDPQLVAQLQEELGEDLAQHEAEVRKAIRANHPEMEAELTRSPDAPNKRGLAIIAYVQWLGSWLEEYPDYEAFVPLDEQMANPLE
ncbi:MAG TPA: cbb3-type cytochrome c oxidase subunit II [Lacipirellulaceae bacterium]|nr:cbb3-type cytochrome c oxidase subunit II [Lacipirellulaceae bacterium]